MEPLEAFSLAAAVAQFIDFGLRIANNAREIYGSLSGATDENRSLEAAVREVQDLTDKLVCSQSACLTEEDRTLNNLVLECQSVSSQLLVLLDKCKAKDPKSKVQSALAAVKSRHYEREKSSLQKRLEQCRLRLERLLCAMSRLVRPWCYLVDTQDMQGPFGANNQGCATLQIHDQGAT